MNKNPTFGFLLIAGFFLFINSVNAEEIATSTTSTAAIVDEIEKPLLPSNFSTLRGQITLASGEPITGTSVSIVNSEGLRYFAPTDKDGNFFFTSPEGNYKVEAVLPPDRTDLIKPLPYFTTLIASEIRVLPITIDHSESIEKSVGGKIVCKDGRQLAGVTVNAYNRQTGQWITTKSNEQGIYKLNLAIGTWMINLAPGTEQSEDWNWNGLPTEIVFGANERNDVRKLNFNVNEAETPVAVKLLKENLLPISDASVSIEKQGFKFPNNEQQIKKVDAFGVANFKLANGKYLIKIFTTNPEIITPKERVIEIKNNKTLNFEITLTEKRTIPSSISGNIKLENGSPAIYATVWSWSDHGDLRKTTTDQNGNYTFNNLLSGRWHLNAKLQENDKIFQNQNQHISLYNNNYTLNLMINKTDDGIYQKSTWLSPEEPILIRSITGASVYLPPTAVATTTVTGTVYISISNAPEINSKNQIRFIGSPYEITATQENGRNIDWFDKEIEITLPYPENASKKLGIKEEDIVPGYFNHETGLWVKSGNYMLNKDKKIVVIKTNHLSVYSLLAPPDLTPPGPASKPFAIVREIGTVNLTWTNPKNDFGYVKIYRSEKKSSLGELISDNTTSNTYIDTNLQKKVYFYTIKASDNNGNESKGVSLVINAGKLNVPSKISPGLKLGSSGETVRLLQKALIKSGALPEDFVITGKIDNTTLNAVKEFQKNNKLPVTNNIGPKTTLALNKLLN